MGKLCNETIETCAKILDDDAYRQEQIWIRYIVSGRDGPATDYSSIPKAYAREIRKLKI